MLLVTTSADVLTVGQGSSVCCKLRLGGLDMLLLNDQYLIWIYKKNHKSKALCSRVPNCQPVQSICFEPGNSTQQKKVSVQLVSVPIVTKINRELFFFPKGNSFCYKNYALILQQASGHYMYRTVVTICTAQWSLYVPPV